VNEDLETMVGRRILVGITYLNGEGEPQKFQFAGIVTAIDPMITIDHGEDEPFTLPADPDAYDRAEAGEHRLRSTGEVVVNPDFVTSWTVRPHTEDDE
jgi:hypothetical protein